MDYNQAIESVCFKFGHAVTEYDVFRWLRNFDESEWPMALNVLGKVIYYSSDRIDETLYGVKAKFQLAGNYWRARWKFKHFTDITWLRALLEWVLGAVFDRHPSLD